MKYNYNFLFPEINNSSDFIFPETNFRNTNISNSIRMNISQDFLTLSRITPKSSFGTKSTTLEKISKELKNKKIAYPNGEEIPIIRIKNENLFESGESIEKYINNLAKFDDNKFNKCNICKKVYNNYFCKDCYKNICDICHKNCMKKNHKLINLIEEQKKIIEYIMNIRLIFAENFILPKKNKDNDGIIKEFKNNNFSDEYEMNNTFEEKQSIMDYPYDIILIEAIIEKIYINYFHYKNIEECFNYIVKKNSTNPTNDKLNIQSGSENNIMNIEEDLEDNSDDYIIIKYKLKNGKKKIKIFGEEFANKYKNICKIIYENEIYELTAYSKFKNISGNNIIEIKLKGVNNINDTNNMFYNCSSLISLPDISNWNTGNVKDMSWMFSHCSSLISLPDISNWNTNEVENMKGIFSDCPSLISLPDISNWNTSNVKDMSWMFSCCLSLKSLPDISNWNTNKVIKMIGIFNNCSSLISLPDISNWNTKNVKDMS